MLFFTLPNSQHAAVVSGGGFFSWGTKFKYTGRTEREILTESINILREQKLTNSSASKRKASSVPATPSSPQGDLAQIRYSSLPRSTMSEPLTTYNLASTDVFNQNLGYDTTGSGAVLASGLEPVSEEARLKSFHNINMLNNRFNTDITAFCANSEDSMLYSSTGSGKFCTYENQNCFPKYSENRPNSLSQQGCSNDTLSNFCTLSANTSMGGGSPTSEIQYNTSAKAVRKFHFINAFIPSFVFVVFAMMISAIIVLETDSDLFEQIRNLPEMISLRYQYYEPLKEYLLQKVGQKT